MNSRNVIIVRTKSKYYKVLTTMVFLLSLSVLLVCNNDPVGPPPPPPPGVVGSIEGTVLKNAGTCSDGNMGPNVWVHWTINNELDSVATDDLGYFLIPDLAPGEYNLTFVYRDPENEQNNNTEEKYYPVHCSITIPDLEYFKGDIDVNPSGHFKYRAILGDNAPEVHMYENTASVTGALILASHDGLLSPVVGAIVRLVYPEESQEGYWWEHRSFITLSDANGNYSFTNIPVFDGEIELKIPSYTSNNFPFESFSAPINLECSSKILVEDIIMFSDCRHVPTVLSYNFGGNLPFNYSSNLILNFSEPMDTLTFDFALLEGYDIVQTTYSWDDNDSILTIDPTLILKTDTDYILNIDTAFSKFGCQLVPQFRSLHFWTEDGIQLFSTNVEIAPGEYNDFPIDDPITLTFTMPPIVETLTLTDVTLGDPVFPVAIDYSIAGNVLTITPGDVLEYDHNYKICYRVNSSIPRDYEDRCITFQSELGWDFFERVHLEIGDPNFVADWNTKSVPLKWTKANRAQYYLIYAYDNSSEHPNTDFIRIDSVASMDHLQFQEKDVVLPAQFDRYNNDGIQTPFTDNTTLYFMVRAGNAAGLGPHSDTIAIKDTTPPGGGNSEDGGNDSLDVYITYGSADNVNGVNEDTVWLNLKFDLEYMQTSDNPIFNFVEAGGDETYKIPNTNGVGSGDIENRHNDFENIRATGAYFTVPTGECGAGDSLYLTFTDESGNDTTIQIRLTPYIDYSSPSTGNVFEADDVDENWVNWTVTDIKPPHQTSYVDYYLSLDGGVTFIDSFINFGDGSYREDPELSSQWMSDGNAQILLVLSDGGCQWWSDYFTISGIMLTGPDSATYAEMNPIYDAEGSDSTVIPMTWDFVGIDSVGIWYKEDDASWVLHDSVSNTGSYDFYAPNLGYDYDCRIAVRDFDTDNYPRDSITWHFKVINK